MRKRKPETLFMETTKIEPEQTVTEIQQVLGKYGAGAILTEYDKGQITGVAFKINVNGKEIPFRLPCRWQAIHKTLSWKRKKSRYDSEERDIQQAKRIAWRQLLRWIEAQMALVQTDMVKIQEVFMPYIQVNLAGQTLYEKIEQSKFKMIENKSQ